MSRATPEQAATDLYKAGPGGICAACGHFASRHHGLKCRFPRPCTCEGMLWQGQRLEMDFLTGPVLSIDRSSE